MREPEMVELDMQIVKETEKAVLATLNVAENAVWLPLSQIFMLDTVIEGIETISMPVWLATEKGLV